MDYNFDTLGTRNFEHLSQSLAAKVLGPRVVVFGDGPDGGREATWQGNATSLGSLESWDGYGVVQAKFKQHTESPARNLLWLKSEVRKELADWAKVGTKRVVKPDFFLFTTNVRLSSVPNSGKDEIENFISEQVAGLGLPIQEFKLWEYSDLVARLDDAADIRKRYAAFVTPGDVVATLLEHIDGDSLNFGQAMAAYTARVLRDENLLNLTQAGTAGDGQVTIGDVFIDLPAILPRQPWVSAADSRIDAEIDADIDIEMDEVEIDGFESDFEVEGNRSGIARHLIQDFNHIPDSRREGAPHPHRTVLVGGPGQGKSTVTQWLAQLYRVEFLRESGIARNADVAAAIDKIDDRHGKLRLPEVKARRWPIRIVLTELADYLAKSPGRSLLHYISSKVSERSSFEVDATMLRKWLANYPWLLLIDGLDEVPESSNRGSVMAAIQDFFLDVASIDGDVAAVATTRPQGYGEEFSPKDYRHFQLQPLLVEEALEYAERLVSVRAGEGTSNAAKVMARLDRASREEHTRKLFESPLQVTILEVLLERLGKAPSDRSRLYSAYYRVISQREQEKSGALSDLLQRYESDVDYLHRRVGFELQRRSAEVGETSASLSLEEFEAFITARFRDQGHPESEVVSLARDFARLVTDRLVFLAKLQADKVGFELRSLQEFMAAEFLVNLPESRVIGEIQKIAPAPFWRNVVLFAIGSIFAHREHLRAEVTILCDRMNDDTKAATMILPGAELALDILRDGSCISMPRYAESLARNSLRLLDVPAGTRARALQALVGTDLENLLWEKLESQKMASTSSWINRAHILSSLANGGDARATAALTCLFDKATDELKQHLIVWAWVNLDRSFGEIIGEQFALCGPDTFFGGGLSRRHRNLHPREQSSLPLWMKNLRVLNGSSAPSIRGDSRPSDENAVIIANYTGLGSHLEVWEWAREVASKFEDWQGLATVASFALEPTATTLASALESEQSGLVDNFRMALPWPFAACIRRARATESREFPASFADVLSNLALSARNGELGDIDDWQSAEDRWGPVIAVNREMIASAGSRTSTSPLWPGLKSGGYVPAAYSYSVVGLPTDDEEETLIPLVRSFLKHSQSEETWVHLALFLLSMLEGPDSWGGKSPDDSELKKLRGEIERSLPKRGTGTVWISWLGLASISQSDPSNELLIGLGLGKGLLGRVELDQAQILLDRSLALAGGNPIIRLALVSSPELLEEVSSSALAAWDPSDIERGDVIVEARALLGASQERVWAGDFDSEIRRIASISDDSIGANWFVGLLVSRDKDSTVEIAAHGAAILESSNPLLAEEWLTVAWRHSRSRAVASDLAGD